jgi:hypothetical protein
MPQILTMLSSAATHAQFTGAQPPRGGHDRATDSRDAVSLPESGQSAGETSLCGDRHSASPLWPQAVEDISEEVRITLNHGVPTPDMVVIEEDGWQAAFTGERHGDYLLVPRKFRHLRLLNGEQTVADIVLEKG